jgi:hypothetical protein
VVSKLGASTQVSPHQEAICGWASVALPAADAEEARFVPAASAASRNLPNLARTVRSHGPIPAAVHESCVGIFDELPNPVQYLSVADGVFSKPFDSRTAEYAGWVRIVGTWVHHRSVRSGVRGGAPTARETYGFMAAVAVSRLSARRQFGSREVCGAGIHGRS